MPGAPGQYFKPSGYSHVLLSDMRFATYQHFAMIWNEGNVVQGASTPQRVE